MMGTLALLPIEEVQENSRPEDAPPRSRRKFYKGAILRFRGYNTEETEIIPTSTFKRGDLLRVLPKNGCGLGLDVRRLSDGVIDMVFDEEVSFSRHQAQLAWDARTVWVHGLDVCLARYSAWAGRFDVHRAAAEQETKGQCLDCGTGSYATFVERVARWHHYQLPSAEQLEGFAEWLPRQRSTG